MTSFIKPPRTRRTKPFSRPSPLGRLYMLLIGVFLYAPIAVMAVFSFNDSKTRGVWVRGTFRHYESLIENDTIMTSLYTSLSVAFLAALIATIIGTAAAIGIHAMRHPPRNAMLTLNNVPVVAPDIVTGVSFRMLFVVFLGLLAALGVQSELGFATLLLSHIAFCIPYVILSVMPKLSQMGKHTYEAALDLGAKPSTAFRKVILPEILPGVISGALIAFTMSIDDFTISYFTSGSTVQTLPVTIFSMTKHRISPEINALSTIMFVSVLLLLILINVFQSRDNRRQMHRRNR